MSSEAIAALIAGCFSIVTLIVNMIVILYNNKLTRSMHDEELSASEKRLLIEMEDRRSQWIKSYQIDTNRQLLLESNLELIRHRLREYGKVWSLLKITSSHEWNNLSNPKIAVQYMADQLTDISFNEVGLIMSNRSRQLLLEVRSLCGLYINGKLEFEKIHRLAHLLKHSLRADIGISTEEFENDFKNISSSLSIED